MKFLGLTLIGVITLNGTSRAQQTEVVAQNEKIKVELTRFSKSCDDLMTGSPNESPAGSICVEMAITNNSPRAITAWIAITKTDHLEGSRHAIATGIIANDHVLDTTVNSPEILPRDTHRPIMGNPDTVEFKAAIFEDGSVFGDSAWADRIVENRRQVYQDAALALQKLRLAQQTTTSADQLIQEFEDLDRKEKEAEAERGRTLSGPARLRLPRPGIFGTVSINLERMDAHEGSVLPPNHEIEFLKTMLFEIAYRIMHSQPPITSHPTPLGEPLEDLAPPPVGAVRP